MIDLSIIIPHKNIPDLLKRCLNSIPLKDNHEIIIVDDNSDSHFVEELNYLYHDRPDTKMIFTKDGKGAGYARNIGLKHASGKWILFADADDFFMEHAFDFISNYFTTDYDLIFFNGDAKYNKDLSKTSHRRDFYHMLIDNDDINSLRFCSFIITLKLIKRDLIIDNNISFEEIPVSNDVYFSLIVGLKAQNIAIDKNKIMCVTEREGSLMGHKQTKEERIIRFDAIIRCNQMLKSTPWKNYRVDALKWYFGENLNTKNCLSPILLLRFINATGVASFKYLYWALVNKLKFRK